MYEDFKIEPYNEYESVKNVPVYSMDRKTHKVENKRLSPEPENKIQPAHEINSAKLQTAVETTNKLMDSFYKGYKFKYNENTDRYQVSIINKDTGEVIKEIPPENVMKLAEQLQENLSALIDKYS